MRDACQTVGKSGAALATVAMLHAIEMRSEALSADGSVCLQVLEGSSWLSGRGGSSVALTVRGRVQCGMYDGKSHSVPGSGVTGKTAY